MNVFLSFLRRLGGTGAYHQDGVRIERINRDQYRYVIGDYKTDFYAQVQSGDPSVIIDSKSIHNWLPPHESESISKEEKQEIISNICKFFDYYDESYSVD